MKEKNGEHPFGDTGQLMFFLLFLAFWVVDSFVLHLSTFLADTVPLMVRLVILVLAVTAAICLIRSGHAVVGHGKRPTEIVTTGVFRYVRHPLYAGCLLFYLGLTVSTLSLLSMGLFIVIVIFYNYIADYEEKLMLMKHGDAYEAYMRTTGKWIPGIK